MKSIKRWEKILGEIRYLIKLKKSPYDYDDKLTRRKTNSNDDLLLDLLLMVLINIAVWYF